MTADTPSPARIRELAAFQQSRILLSAYELDLFTALGSESRSAGEVAAVLGTDERATDRLMNALCALELLEKNAGRFANTPLSAQFLVRGKPDYMAGLMHTVHLWDSWSTLTQAVQQGRSVGGPLEERDEGWFRAFIDAMHGRAQRQAPAVAALLDLSRVDRALDVGGGSGVFAMAIARACEGISATIFDLPNVVVLTRDYIAREGLSDRVDTAAGDYHIDDLGSGFDLVFLSAIIHSNSFEQNQDLIQKCARALNPGGQVVVQDFIVDEDRTRPAFAALFALNMLVGTQAGDTYTESEVRAWMEAAGLAEIDRQDTDFGTTLITGRKA